MVTKDPRDPSHRHHGKGAQAERIDEELKPTEDETTSGARQPRRMLRKRKAGETASPNISSPNKKKTKLQQAKPKSRQEAKADKDDSKPTTFGHQTYGGWNDFVRKHWPDHT